MSGWIPARVDAVIFDHDGTLVDSENITLSVVAAMAVERGADVYPEDAERFVGADLHAVIEEIGHRTGKAIDTDAFMTEFRIRQTTAIEEGLDEIPGATALLERLSSSGVPVAVASNAPVAKMRLCLEATNLLRFFEEHQLVSAYDVGLWKPDPAVFVRAAEILDVAPNRCAVLEDSAPGVEAARRSGSHVLALGSRFSPSNDLTVAPTISDAEQILFGS